MTASAGPALRELHEEYGDRVEFLSLYVREAHPGDRYPQPHTLGKKLEHARAYAERDGIRWTVAVDTVEGDLHRRLDEKPHSAYFVDRDGVVADRLLWANDTAALAEGLDDLAAGRPLQLGQRESQVVPMVRGMGRMHDVIGSAGPVALKDLRHEAPPAWLFAVIAGWFRPLSPLGRGVAALASVAGGLLAAGWLATRLVRGRSAERR